MINSTRETERENFVIEETLRLQDEEIERLKEEYFDIEGQINLDTNEANRIYNSLKSTVKGLKNKISAVVPRNLEKKYSLDNEYTKILNSLIESHGIKIQKLRIGFEKRLNTLKSQLVLQNSQDDPVFVRFSEEIDALRSQYDEFMKIQEGKRRKYIEEKALEYKNKAVSLRNREIELKKSINAYINEIEKIRSDCAAKVAEMHNDFANSPQTGFSLPKSEQILAAQDTISYTNISNFMKEKMDTTSKLNESISLKKERVSQLKSLIRESDGTDTNDLDEAKHNLEQLHAMIENIEPEETESEINLRKQIGLAKNEIINIQGELKQKNSEIVMLIRDNGMIKEEIKRLDFLIYGRNGKYQNREQMNKKKPFIH